MSAPLKMRAVLREPRHVIQLSPSVGGIFATNDGAVCRKSLQEPTERFTTHVGCSSASPLRASPTDKGRGKSSSRTSGRATGCAGGKYKQSSHHGWVATGFENWW